MITVIAAVIGGILAGLITGLKTPLLAPVIYLSKFRKYLFLVLFSVYSLALGYEFEITNIYTADMIMILAVLLPTILLLDVGLRADKDVKANMHVGNSIRKVFKKGNPAGYVLAISILIGLIVKEIFVAVLLIVLLHNFSKDRPKKGVYAALGGISLLTIGLISGRSMIDLLGSASTQVVFISAITISVVLFMWRRVQTTKLFN